MVLAVTTIVTHSAMPHQHFDFMDVFSHHAEHHDEDDSNPNHQEEEQNGDQHNIFSFAQLDEDYLPQPYKISIDLPVLYVLAPVISNEIKISAELIKNHYGHYREFPPPDDVLSILFSRPPPAFI
jgi:hypothetical protein